MTGVDEVIDGAADERANEGHPGPDEKPASGVGRTSRLAVRERGHAFEARHRGRIGAPREAEVRQLATGRRHRRRRRHGHGHVTTNGRPEELEQEHLHHHLPSTASSQLGLLRSVSLFRPKFLSRRSILRLRIKGF